ncbi:MAG: hypothetical protein ACF8PN_11895 [Phycisphaerales bacterium]
MGTSSWQNIPYCIDILMKIEPKRVLDIGVGFGRWGMITREFCDVWFQRVLEEEWAVHIEGIEGFEQNVSDYHRSFYNKIHIGDAREIIPSLNGPWDVTIYGDVLEHFERETAIKLLNASLAHSNYVLINIPLGDNYPQDVLYENEYERHLSVWEPDDFNAFPLVRRSLFRDFMGRPFGSFLLSHQDPRDLQSSLFSTGVKYNEDGQGVADARTLAELQALRDRAAEQAFELGFIKGHTTYRIAKRLRKNRMWQAVRWAKTRDQHVVTIEALGEAHPDSEASEVWLVQASRTEQERSVPWDFVEPDASWSERASEKAPYGKCLMSRRGKLRVSLGADPKLVFVKHPWSGKVRVTMRGRSEVIDLYSAETDSVTVYPARRPMLVAESVAKKKRAASLSEPRPLPSERSRINGSVGEPKSPVQFTAAEERTINDLRERNARVLAIHCPRWLGITNATKTLFEHTYAFPATIDDDPFDMDTATVRRHAELIIEAGIEHVVFSGGDEINLHLLEELHELKPDLRFDLLWHGSYVQFCENYAWEILKRWIDATKAGYIHSIGVVKKGMEKFFESTGLRSALVLNFVPGAPEKPPVLDGDEWHLGMWISGSSYRKIPHAMLSAVKMVDSARLHAAGLDERSREVIELFDIPTAEVHSRPIPYEELLGAMRRTHMSLYVTFSECCPMLPLESLSVGVPCLLGPTSHLFEDHDYLRSRLVVPYPDRADVIAKYIERGLAERGRIMDEYSRYAPEYEARARQSVEAFLGAPVATA